jgi:hypothetical protein
MEAHQVMGDNMTYEDLKGIADGNDTSVGETLEIISRTAAIDRARHRNEYIEQQGAREPRPQS